MISRSVTISKIFHKIKSKLKSKLEEHDLMNHEERCSACAQKTKKNNKFQKPEDALVKRTLTEADCYWMMYTFLLSYPYSFTLSHYLMTSLTFFKSPLCQERGVWVVRLQHCTKLKVITIPPHTLLHTSYSQFFPNSAPLGTLRTTSPHPDISIPYTSPRREAPPHPNPGFDDKSAFMSRFSVLAGKKINVLPGAEVQNPHSKIRNLDKGAFIYIVNFSDSW